MESICWTFPNHNYTIGMATTSSSVYLFRISLAAQKRTTLTILFAEKGRPPTCRAKSMGSEINEKQKARSNYAFVFPYFFRGPDFPSGKPEWDDFYTRCPSRSAFEASLCFLSADATFMLIPVLKNMTDIYNNYKFYQLP